MRYSHVNPLELKTAVDELGAKIVKKDTNKIQSNFPNENPTFDSPSKPVVNQAEKETSGRWQSGQMHQTVNLAGYALHRFESCPAHIGILENQRFSRF